MTSPETTETSAFRLRLGIILFFLWWLPIWALIPAISDALGTHSPKHLAAIVIGIQTVIGLVGLLVAGKQILIINRQTSFKKMPKAVWHVLRTGTMIN